LMLREMEGWAVLWCFFNHCIASFVCWDRTLSGGAMVCRVF
jgi:hypothetical protein